MDSIPSDCMIYICCAFLEAKVVARVGLTSLGFASIVQFSYSALSKTHNMILRNNSMVDNNKIWRRMIVRDFGSLAIGAYTAHRMFIMRGIKFISLEFL
jgi:hypothetical protein